MFQNILRSDPNFSKMVEYVRGHTIKFCKSRKRNGSGVVNSYAKNDALPSADGILIAYEPVERKTRSQVNFIDPSGFVLYQLKSDYVYIDVICSLPGTGKELLRVMEDVAKYNKKKYLVLSALNHVIFYYKKQGFQFAFKGCTQDPDIDAYISRYFPVQNRSGQNRTMEQFLRLLIRKGLASNKKCRTTRNCNNYGYYMTKCVN